MDAVELEAVWPKMNIQDRCEVVKAVSAYQKFWASVSFEQFGSLYFAEDLKGENVTALVYTDSQGRRVEDPRFVVGPSTSREMFDDGRDDVDFDRGPCVVNAQTMTSIHQCITDLFDVTSALHNAPFITDLLIERPQLRLLTFTRPRLPPPFHTKTNAKLSASSVLQ
ncbi:hypothetical protein E4U57_000293 [Claviceps arundinis]|uniref:Uncharacterized protein n=1 Tax=Claviceps arundinis TaxID=1623583 RepID=A0ABQ7PDB6_9HYPO|nr:hypothetical protein E4U57_000293 [Claviceps arundinis]